MATRTRLIPRTLRCFREVAGPDGVGDVETWPSVASMPIEYKSTDDMLASIDLNGIDAVDDTLYTVQTSTAEVVRIGVERRRC